MWKKLWQDQKGITLIELLVASVILLVALVPLLAGLTTGMRSNNAVQPNIIAYNLAAKKIEQVRQDYKANPTSLEKTYPAEIINNNGVPYTINANTTFATTVSPYQLPPMNLFNVTVTVNWVVDGAGKNYNMNYLLIAGN